MPTTTSTVFASGANSRNVTCLSGSTRVNLSPNVSVLDKAEWKENADGVTLDESLFIVELKTGRIVREISKDYRSTSSAAWLSTKWSGETAPLLRDLTAKRGLCSAN